MALLVPATVGLNTMLTVQLADTPRVAPQVLLEIAKSPGFVPPSAMPLIVIAVFVPLFNVTIWAKLVAPGAVFANPRLVGATVTLPAGATPVPDKETI